MLLGLLGNHAVSAAQDPPLKTRNIDASRNRATSMPRSEGDQALLDGWPLYRTERGQQAYNDMMATLKASEAPPPNPAVFKGCAGLDCALKLPAIAKDGWLQAGRIWISPDDYVLVVHSPRPNTRRQSRRRDQRSMRYFVFHEFHNSSRNTDPYDTISSHSGSVFVPLYMSKGNTDAQGRRFVVIVQVAPYDVYSIHASNMGSAGPGIEVAKNYAEPLEPLQASAGIIVASIVKNAAPQLRVVNHRGAEGLPMLSAYERHVSTLKARPGAPALTLPFVPVSTQRIASATGKLEDLIEHRGASKRIPIAERGVIPPKLARADDPSPAALTAPTAGAAAPSEQEPQMLPVTAYLQANLAAMMSHPDYSSFIPQQTVAIAEEMPITGAVYLLNADQEVLGRIEPLRSDKLPVEGRYAYVALDSDSEDSHIFDLDISKPLTIISAALMDEPQPQAKAQPQPRSRRKRR